MTRKELSENSAKYAVLHRQMFDVLNGAMVLSEVEKLSKNRPDVMEMLEAYQQTRLKLLEASQWYQMLHRYLMFRTEEGKQAMQEYQAQVEQAEKEAAAKSAEAATEAPAEASAEASVEPKLTLLPQVTDEAPNG